MRTPFPDSLSRRRKAGTVLLLSLVLALTQGCAPICRKIGKSKIGQIFCDGAEEVPVVILRGGAELHARPGSETRIRALSEGEVLIASELVGDWVRVQSLRGEEGWVHRDRVRPVESAEPPPSPPPQPSSGPELSFPEPRSYVATARVNVRTGPGTNHQVLTTVLPGARLLADGSSGDWLHGKVAGQDGWIHGRYLDIEAGAPVETPDASRSAQREKERASVEVVVPPPTLPRTRIGPDGAAVRSAMSAVSAVACRLEPNAEVEVLKRTGGWLHVRSGRCEGYVVPDSVIEAP